MSFARFKHPVACAALACAGLIVAGSGWLPGAQRPADVRPEAVEADDAGSPASYEDGEPGITEPSQLLELSFSIPGVVEELPIKEGDVVKKGQLLVGLDTKVEKAQLAQAELKAKSPHQLRAAEADRDAKVVELDRQKDLWAKEATSKAELQKAEVDVVIANIRIDLTKEETTEAGLAVKEQQERIRLKRLLSPVSGVVKKLEAGPGEIVDPQKPAVVLVSNNPLWVKLDLPTAQSKALKEGQKLQVRYADEQKWREAVVIFMDPVVNASADQQFVRLEMPNTDGQASGQQVFVKLPEKVATAGE